MADCVFCRIASGDTPATIVDQDELVVAFEDLNPQAPVHVLVIPRKHVATVADVADPAALAAMVKVAHRIAKSRGIAKTGYRLVYNTGQDGGQTVFHAHVHLLGGRRMNWPPG